MDSLMENEIKEICEISGGNPGTLTVLGRYLNPSNGGSFATIRKLAQLGIKNELFWALHKNICAENFKTTFSVMEALAKAEDPWLVGLRCKNSAEPKPVLLTLGIEKPKPVRECKRIPPPGGI
jgi:hypothetical protein